MEFIFCNEKSIAQFYDRAKVILDESLSFLRGHTLRLCKAMTVHTNKCNNVSFFIRRFKQTKIPSWIYKIKGIQEKTPSVMVMKLIEVIEMEHIIPQLWEVPDRENSIIAGKKGGVK